MYVTDYYGNKVKVHLVFATYYNKNLAIRIWTDEGEPWASLTVNLCDGKSSEPLINTLGEEYAFVDVNNFPEAIDFINRYKLAEFAGVTKRSGYVDYPLYKFDLNRLEEVTNASKRKSIS